jgi:hypothetical protein
METRRDVYRVLVLKHEGKRLLGRPRYRRKDNIKMDGLMLRSSDRTNERGSNVQLEQLK